MGKILPFYTCPEQWAQDITKQYPQSCPLSLLISDVDNTLLDSNRAWYEDYVRLAIDKGVTMVDKFYLSYYNQHCSILQIVEMIAHEYFLERTAAPHISHGFIPKHPKYQGT